MTWVANIVYLVLGVLYLPMLLYQMLVQKKNRRGWRQRFGHLHLPPPQGGRIWLHAVSLGEVNCTPALVRELTAARPECDVVVSTTTDTGYARACKLYTPERVFRYPLDLSWIVRRALDRIRPTLIVLVELEVWPNLVRLARQRGIPVVVINGRLTERSARRLTWLGGATRGMFARLDWVGAQEERIAARFRQMGVPPERVVVTGSLKWDTAEVVDTVPGAEALAAALGLPAEPPRWVCGSTGPGEEELILEAYARLLGRGGRPMSLVIVPRKPERFDEVAALIRAKGFVCVRRSEHADGAAAARPEGLQTVFLGDTMGELRKFYTLARVVFVGRSLVPMGGSDPMEVAALGKPVVVGPHMDNFREPVEALAARDAVRVVASAAALAETVGELAADRGLAEALGRRARAVVIENQGATERTVRALVEVLGRGTAGSAGPGWIPKQSSQGVVV